MYDFIDKISKLAVMQSLFDEDNTDPTVYRLVKQAIQAGTVTPAAFQNMAKPTAGGGYYYGGQYSTPLGQMSGQPYPINWSDLLYQSRYPQATELLTQALPAANLAAQQPLTMYDPYIKDPATGEGSNVKADVGNYLRLLEQTQKEMLEQTYAKEKVPEINAKWNELNNLRIQAEKGLPPGTPTAQMPAPVFNTAMLGANEHIVDPSKMTNLQKWEPWNIAGMAADTVLHQTSATGGYNPFNWRFWMGRPTESYNTLQAALPRAGENLQSLQRSMNLANEPGNLLRPFTQNIEQQALGTGAAATQMPHTALGAPPVPTVDLRPQTPQEPVPPPVASPSLTPPVVKPAHTVNVNSISFLDRLAYQAANL